MVNANLTLAEVAKLLELPLPESWRERCDDLERELMLTRSLLESSRASAAVYPELVRALQLELVAARNIATRWQQRFATAQAELAKLRKDGIL